MSYYYSLITHNEIIVKHIIVCYDKTYISRFAMLFVYVI